ARVRVAGADGPLVDETITFGEFAEAVRYQLYAPGRAAGLPSMLTRAAAGDYAPIANAAIANRAGIQRGIWHGMYLSVTCAEDIPGMTPRDIRDATSGTRLGDYRVRQQIEACHEWPRGAAPGPHFGAPVQTPALVLVGEFDPATPLPWARRALTLLPNGRLIIVPHGAHAFGGLGIDACLATLTSDFITRGSARDVDSSCVAAARRPPFTLR
ncbi:MAG: alpha/beta hydrolase, partial [Acidobacteriota bacterium]|nr:alpha/beta hydrolase [Acidobacteriota bacterium]